MWGPPAAAAGIATLVAIYAAARRLRPKIEKALYAYLTRRIVDQARQDAKRKFTSATDPWAES